MNEGKKLRVIFAVVLVLIMATTAVFAGTASKEEAITFDAANNCLSAGSNPMIADKDVRDALIAGANVRVEGINASNNTFAAGSDVSLNNVAVEGDMAVAGANVSIKDAKVNSNIFAVGKDVNAENVLIKGCLYASGAKVNYTGEALGLSARGETVKINGIVHGDVKIEAEKVIIGEKTVIEGRLDVTAAEKPEISDKAKISELNYTEAKQKEESSAALELAKKTIYWSFAMIIMALAICYMYNPFIENFKSCAIKNMLVIIGSGALALIAIPAMGLLCCITVVGLPLGLIIITLFVIMIIVSQTLTGVILGRALLPQLKPMLGSIIGVLVLVICDRIPYLGFITSLLALLFAFGCITQYAIRYAKNRKNGGEPDFNLDVEVPQYVHVLPEEANE